MCVCVCKCLKCDLNHDYSHVYKSGACPHNIQTLILITVIIISIQRKIVLIYSIYKYRESFLFT